MLSFTSIVTYLENKKEDLAKELLNRIDNYPKDDYFTIILRVNPNNTCAYYIEPENENYINAFGFAINVVGFSRENYPDNPEITLKNTRDALTKAIAEIQSHINHGQIYNY